jgi:hypothetical protein
MDESEVNALICIVIIITAITIISIAILGTWNHETPIQEKYPGAKIIVDKENCAERTKVVGKTTVHYTTCDLIAKYPNYSVTICERCNEL